MECAYSTIKKSLVGIFGGLNENVFHRHIFESLVLSGPVLEKIRICGLVGVGLTLVEEM